MMPAEPGSTLFRFSVLTPDDAAYREVERPIILEAPVAIEFNGIGYAVMMATPTDLEDYAVGFCLSEKLIDHPDQILSIEVHEAEIGCILRIQLASEKVEKVAARARQRVSESSCGLCGMDNIDEVMRPLPYVTAQVEVSDAAIFASLNALRAHQVLNAATGASHGAAFCASDGTILLTREDVGRHNALDKLIGALAKAGIDPSCGFMLVTARCSFELAQKAILANCPMLVSISAATHLAITMAAKYGLRLVSIARLDGALDAGRQSGGSTSLEKLK